MKRFIMPMLSGLLLTAELISCNANASAQISSRHLTVSKGELTHDLSEYLHQNFSQAGVKVDSTARVSIEFANFSGSDKQLILVYAWDRANNICGTGGCNLIVVQKDDGKYHLKGDIDLVRRPIRILTTFTKGLPDLGVWVEGGGVQPGYEAKLRFDGTSYPENPTEAPAVHNALKTRGLVIFRQGDEGIPF